SSLTTYGRDTFSRSAACWVVSSAWVGIRVTACPWDISVNRRRNRRTAEAGTSTGSTSSFPPSRSWTRMLARRPNSWAANCRLDSRANVVSVSVGATVWKGSGINVGMVHYLLDDIGLLYQDLEMDATVEMVEMTPRCRH